MTADACLKNEFTEDEKCDNLMRWLKCPSWYSGPVSLFCPANCLPYRCSCLPWPASDSRQSFKSFLTGASFLFGQIFRMSLTAISLKLRSSGILPDVTSMDLYRLYLEVRGTNKGSFAVPSLVGLIQPVVPSARLYSYTSYSCSSFLLPI